MAKKVFTLDKYDFLILQEFAKKGENYRNGLNFTLISKKQTSRRIDKLEKYGFLNVVNSTPHRNMKGKYTKLIGLSTKGFLASLSEIEMENNYIIKKYLKNIENQAIQKMTLDYIKSDLEYFLKHNEIRGMVLDKIKNIPDWFYDYDHSYGFSHKDLETLKEIKKEKEEKWKTLNKNIKKQPNMKNNQIKYFEKWHDGIESLSHKNNYEETLKHLSNKKIKQEKPNIILEHIEIVENQDLATEEISIEQNIVIKGL